MTRGKGNDVSGGNKASGRNGEGTVCSLLVTPVKPWARTGLGKLKVGFGVKNN